VEKTLLITSTTNAFPILSEAAKDPFTATAISFRGTTQESVPSTPLFSPIPFLHDDARRSKSLSPPPSPLVLGMNPGTSMLAGSEQKALGLVDELDDPGPGHLRDNPTAISSVTTMPSRPLLGSLEQRFVKAEDEGRREMGEGDMILDDADDKENKG
jgi:serine/threonine-protein phosphatase 4 regulatory subunit 2